MNPQAYQRVRLWSGIVSIGINLGVVIALYVSAGWWAAKLDGWVAVAVLAGIPVGITLANLPFEILSGHACEVAAGRTNQPLSEWLSDWMRGVSGSIAAQIFGYLFFFSVSIGIVNPLTAGIAVAVVIILAVLHLSRGPAVATTAEALGLAGFEASMREAFRSAGIPVPTMRWVRDRDVTSVNGCVPVFTRKVVLSSNVATHLTPREAMLMAQRDLWAAGAGIPLKASLIAGGWLFLGVAAAFAVPASNAVQSAVGGCAVVTVWCFLALFVWPSLNRAWSSAADRSLLSLASREEVSALLTKIQLLNATDTALPEAKTAVFHPIPPLRERLNSLS